MPTTERMDAQVRTVAAGLAAATAAPPGAVAAGEAFDLVLDLELAGGAATALIVTVEPARPLRLAGAGRSRAIVRPGEARRTWVAVVLPAETEPGEHEVALAIRAPGGVLLHRACTVEVAPAPTEDVLDLRAVAVDEVIDLRTPEAVEPELPTEPDVLGLPTEPDVVELPRPLPVDGPPSRPAHARREPPAADEFAALRATAAGPKWRRPRRSATDRVLFAVGVVLLVVAVVSAVVSAAADPAGDAEAPPPAAEGEASAAGAAPPAPPSERHAVIGSIVLDGGPDLAATIVTASVAAGDGELEDVVAVPDADGRFRLRLPPGIHRLVVSAPGFRDTPQTVVVEDADVEVPPIALVPA